MKRYLLILLTALFFSQAYSQDVEEMMTKKYISCNDIIYNSSFLIPEHFEKNNMDTLSAIINYWESRCGMNEALLRTKILLAINADTLNESIYDKVPIISYLSIYREEQRIINKVYYGNYYWTQPIDNSFDTFTQELAVKLKNEDENSELESFFLDFYSNNFDEIFFRLQDTSLADTKIKEDYDQAVDRFSRWPDGHFSVYSGVWIPNGKLDILGLHPILGFQGGAKYKKLLVDAIMEFKFVKSPNTYFVQKDDSIYSTTHFFGGFIGLDLGYELIKHKSHEINILGAIGWDGFDAINIGTTNDPNRVTKTINSLNLNPGIGYRKYFKNRSYIGIEARYNFVNYKNNNGTDLSGNSITIRLKYGLSRNLYRDNVLRQFDNKKILSDTKYNEWLQSGRRLIY